MIRFIAQTPLLSRLLPAILVAFMARSASADLTSLAAFNAITGGDITGDSSDVQGRVLVGGTLAVNNFTFGGHLANLGVTSGVNGVFNILGTGVTNPNNNSIATAYYAANNSGGVVTNPAVNVLNAPLVSTYTSNLTSFLSNLSASYGKLTNPASTTTISGGTVTFAASPTTNNGSSVAVFSVNQSVFTDQNEAFKLTGGTSATTYVINVTGSGPLTFAGGLGFSNLVNQNNSANILFNFEGATSLNGIPNLGASILAPDAVLNTSNTLAGGVYVKSIDDTSGSGEIDLAQSNGAFVAGFTGFTPSVVPEPASVAMMFLGGGMAAGCVAYRRRREGQAAPISRASVPRA